MSKFVTKRIIAIRGKQDFRQLIIVDNKIDADKLQTEINKKESDKMPVLNNGVFDDYENSLENKYKGSFRGLMAIMERASNNELLPRTKFRDITPSEELVKEYEIKYQDLRAFAIKIPSGKLIIMGGFKNQQNSDFKKFRSLKEQYLKSIKK